MITFRPMHPLVPLPLFALGIAARPLRHWRLFAMASLLSAFPAAANAQISLTHTEDAAPVPKGMLRFRVTTGWTRFDERFTPTGRRTLGDEISADDFGPRQLPLLLPVEKGLQTLTGDAQTKLSLGRLAVQSDARIVTTPIVLEYGLTRRLTIGVLVPLVQTRRGVSVKVNTDSGTATTQSGANVGFVPTGARTSAAAKNFVVYTAYKSAADSLATLVSKCPTNPTASGCAAVNLNPTDATSAAALARQFADAVKAALGTDTATALIAPREGSALAQSIDAQRAVINGRVQKYLGANAGAATGVFTQAPSFSYIDLQGRNGVPGLLQGPLGGQLDSLQTNNKLVLGGATVGLQFMVFDGFRADTLVTPRWQSRLAVGAAFRYEVLQSDSAKHLGVISASDGSAVELKTAMDVMSGVFGGTIAARYTKYLARTVNAPLAGDPEAFWPVPFFGPATRTSGAVIGLDLTPRLLLGESFALDAHYGFERTGAPTYDRGAIADCALCSVIPAFVPNTSARNAQRVGVGLRYSTFDSYVRGRSTAPIEVSLTHLQTISGDEGVARLQRDQLQVRLFFNVLSKR
ncbi:MAG: hypothetical protein ABI625_08580 [bacterium]